MSTSRLSTGAAFLLVSVAWLFFATPVLAEDEAAALEQAIKLFEEGEYLTAQEVLVGIDRAKLTEGQQTLRDDYLTRVQVAVNMYEKALRDFEDAETAATEGEVDKAERLLESVLANEYAAERFAVPPTPPCVTFGRSAVHPAGPLRLRNRPGSPPHSRRSHGPWHRRMPKGAGPDSRGG